jgi:hypothetical protein
VGTLSPKQGPKGYASAPLSLTTTFERVSWHQGLLSPKPRLDVDHAVVWDAGSILPSAKVGELSQSVIPTVCYGSPCWPTYECPACWTVVELTRLGNAA